jgi:hypothetical protein
MINALLCATIILSFLNLISTLFLSNAMFRIFGSAPTPKRPLKEGGSDSPDKNLVDLKNHPTYDIRFRDD